MINLNGNTPRVQSAGSSLKYNSVFGGECYVTPVWFNPNLKQEQKFTKRPDAYYASAKPKEYVNVLAQSGNSKYSKVVLLCKFNPNEQLGLATPIYKDEYFVEIVIRISDDYFTDGAKTKIQIIDAQLNTAWIPGDASINAKTALNSEIEKLKNILKSDGSNTSVKYSLDQLQNMQASTVRKAKIGEQQLLKLIELLCGFSKPQIREGMSEKEIKNVREWKSIELSNDEGQTPEEGFSRIVNGDFDMLNEIIQSDYVLIDDEPRKLGVFLGGVISTKDATRINQNIFSGNDCVFSHYRSMIPRVLSSAKNEKLDAKFKALGACTLPYSTAKSIVDDTIGKNGSSYEFKAVYGGNATFKEITLEDFKEESSSTTVKSSADDLPF